MINRVDIPAVDFTHAYTVRLIPTAYIDEPAMAPLADDDDELSFLAELEELTSSRQGSGIPLPIGVSSEELVTEYHGYGWTYINAAFCYTRTTGNRFNTVERGAWYAAYGENAVETAQSEVAWHLTRELEATGTFENITSYRELVAGMTTSLHDLSGYDDKTIFDEKPEIAYPVSQVLARNLLAANSNGVLYPSVRKRGGQCVAIFKPHIIQNIRQGSTWEFNWSGTPTPKIKSI